MSFSIIRVIHAKTSKRNHLPFGINNSDPQFAINLCGLLRSKGIRIIHKDIVDPLVHVAEE